MILQSQTVLTYFVRGSMTVPISALDLTTFLHYIATDLLVSNPAKLEVSRTVILPLTKYVSSFFPELSF